MNRGSSGKRVPGRETSHSERAVAETGTRAWNSQFESLGGSESFSAGVTRKKVDVVVYILGCEIVKAFENEHTELELDSLIGSQDVEYVRRTG